MATFSAWIADTIANEGGYVYSDNAGDLGGPTKGGISQAYMAKKLGRPVAAHEIEALTPDQINGIYLSDFWPQMYGLIQSQAVASKLADCGVNCGIGTAVTSLQQTLNDMGAALAVDGAFGPGTLAKTNACNPHDILLRFCYWQALRYLEIIHGNAGQACNAHEWAIRSEYNYPKP